MLFKAAAIALLRARKEITSSSNETTEVAGETFPSSDFFNVETFETGIFSADKNQSNISCLLVFMATRRCECESTKANVMPTHPLVVDQATGTAPPVNLVE